ncbi:MAG: hypothetical protein EOP62_10680 [Sphingomonadales bacterium]|nr:MAG: hypothetical protein EOP62_10680 [Sphingomonadales bacterium]
MIKPLPAMREALIRLCARLGISIHYSVDRWHCTLLLIGESSIVSIDAALRALHSFDGEPFEVAFDSVHGNTLQPQKGIRGPGLFQRALVRHLITCGVDLPAYKFRPHLNLDYGTASDRRVTTPSIGWFVEDIMLIESVNGQGRHIEHGSCQLARRQGMFDFAALAPSNPGSRLSPG